MRIAIIGTGGVGGFFGARLAQRGHDVTFVARGRHLDAIRRDGLRIDSETTPIHIRDARVTDDVQSIGPVDVAMLCVKLWDVEPIVPSLRPLIANGGVVIPFQNGIDAPAIVSRGLSPDALIGGVAYIATSIGSPGVIRHVGTMARMSVGAFDGRKADAAASFADAARGSGIEIALAADIRRAIWEKFVFLSALAGATAITRQPIGVIRADAAMRAMFESIMRETWSVGRASDVALPDDFVATRLAFADTLPYEMKASMLHDLEVGHRLEAPWLCGAVARLGGELGVATPVNETIYAALKPYVAGAAAMAKTS
ncbi:MAG TPA: 2-dehydropantoate 2-reductase [Casimicrobiaceae bacterium]|nr:2-dehydropantoate 2-reductase [Casimicrobiaceae bacterium]